MNGFKKIDENSKKEVSAGFAILPVVMAAIELTYAAIASYKMLNSNNGSFKTDSKGHVSPTWSGDKNGSSLAKTYYVY